MKNKWVKGKYLAEAIITITVKYGTTLIQFLSYKTMYDLSEFEYEKIFFLSDGMFEQLEIDYAEIGA